MRRSISRKRTRRSSSGAGRSALLLLTAGCLAWGQNAPDSQCGAVRFEALQPAVGQIAAASFPQLTSKDIRVRPLRSRNDYLQTRLSIGRLLLPLRMRYFIEVNPALFTSGVPESGVCAILAHEMAHVAELSRGSRIRLFRLIRLASPSYTAGFERRTDLSAIRLGYADGLIAYRQWVYANVSAKAAARKRRNYFTPEEIVVVERRLRAEPELWEKWRRKVPQSLEETERD